MRTGNFGRTGLPPPFAEAGGVVQQGQLRRVLLCSPVSSVAKDFLSGKGTSSVVQDFLSGRARLQSCQPAASKRPRFSALGRLLAEKDNHDLPISIVRSAGLATSLPASAASSSIPITDAAKHVGATKCVTGKVLQVKQGNRSVHFFYFCENYRTCPFTVVVFSGDLKQVGDVRRLEGRQIEIDGEIKSYDGRAEIILSRSSQLRGDAAHIPPCR